MGHGIGVDHLGDLDLALGDQRPGDARSEEIGPLIQGVGAKHRKHEVPDELLAQILDEDLLDAEQLRLLPRRLELLALADVGGEGDDLAAIGLLQPAENDGGVQTAGIGEDDTLDRWCHETMPRSDLKGAEYRQKAGELQAGEGRATGARPVSPRSSPSKGGP